MPDRSFFNKYPYTDFHELNLDWIVDKTEDCVDIVTSYNDRLTAAEGNITNLQGRMTTAEGNITSLQGRMTTAETHIEIAESDIDTLQGSVSSAESDIDALQTAVSNLSDHDETTDRSVASLQADMTTAQQDIDAAEADIDSLETRMTAAEGDIDALEAATTRTGVPIQWASTKGTPQGEIDLQKYGKIRIMYMYGHVENLTAAVSARDLFMTAQLPSDSYPADDIELYVPVYKDPSPFVDILKLKVDKTTGLISVYNDHESFEIGDDSQILHYVLTYNVL